MSHDHINRAGCKRLGIVRLQRRLSLRSRTWSSSMSSTFHSPLHVFSFFRHAPRPFASTSTGAGALRTPPNTRFGCCDAFFARGAIATCRARSHDTSSTLNTFENGAGDAGFTGAACAGTGTGVALALRVGSESSPSA